MVRAAFTAIAGFLLLVTQIQCVAACASDPCDGVAQSESVPPCHRHHHSTNESSPASCYHRTVSAPAIFQPAIHVELPVFVALAVANRVSAGPLADARPATPFPSGFSPPGPAEDLFVTVLRI